MPQNDTTQTQDLIERAAWAYYHDGVKQSDIASRLQVSRASVVNYLAEARARGYVRITMHPEVFSEHQLSAELADALGLESVLVVPDASTPHHSLTRAAKAAAVICGRFVDADGVPIASEMDDRMIGVSLPDMTNKDMGLLVASGPDRAGPARAAIKGGYVTHLTTCTTTARELLRITLEETGTTL